jgi:ribosomal protein S18 acetylase RimI-like enzyme
MPCDRGYHPRMPGVRKATVADAPQVVDTLTAAFLDDPVFAYFLPKPNKRERGTRKYFRDQLRLVYLAKDNVYLTDDGGGAAVWAPPDKWQQPLSVSLRGLPNMVRSAGIGHVPTIFAGLTLLENKHKEQEEPHWYLPYIGVAPSHQGRGYGGALLEHMLERCDEEGRPAYLEASTERNRALYHRHAFEVLEEIRFPKGGPPMWPMWRKAR